MGGLVNSGVACDVRVPKLKFTDGAAAKALSICGGRSGTITFARNMRTNHALSDWTSVEEVEMRID
jgi:hypothetical protein